MSIFFIDVLSQIIFFFFKRSEANAQTKKNKSAYVNGKTLNMISRYGSWKKALEPFRKNFFFRAANKQKNLGPGRVPES